VFKNFPKEKANIIKANKTIIENVEVLFTPNVALIQDVSILLEDGDIIERNLPNGLKDSYLVLDRGFTKGIGRSIPDHYQAKIQKQNSVKKSIAGNSVTNNIINNYGNMDKVNLNSIDNSTNISITENENAIFHFLEETIKSQIENNSELLNLVMDMKENVGKSTFAEKYNEFIQKSVNYMNILAPFIPMLSPLLVK